MENQEEHIEDYLEGRLQGEALASFEEKLRTNAAFASEVDAFHTFTQKLKSHGKRKELKDKLAGIHQEMGQEAVRPLKGKRVFLFEHYRTIAVAASVALVTSIGTLFLVQYYNGLQKDGKAHYRELRKDVERIKQSQNKLWKEVNSEKSTPIPNNFTGTGFAISSDGYVVTSYHVVKNADSVWLENDRYQKMRAKTVYTDKTIDLAILKITDRDFKTFGKLPYSFSIKSKNLGDKIFTIGYPKDDLVYGEGYIGSSTGYEGDTTSYQISIPLNPGNSGGPLLDERGNVIGIVSGKLTEAEGAAFALHTRYIITRVKQLREKDVKIKLPTYSSLTGLSRSEQIRGSKNFVFKIGLDEE